MVYNTVYGFLDVKQLLSPRQYEFQRYHSTLHALVDSVEYILNSQDAGEKVLGIFLISLKLSTRYAIQSSTQNYIH